MLPTKSATPCDRDAFCDAIIGELVNQLSDLRESLARVPGDKLVTMLCNFAESISGDLLILNEAAEVERRQGEIYGEITGHEVVRPTQPPLLRARDVGERLGLSPDAVMRESIRGNLAKPTYVDGSPLWRESDVNAYLAANV
jgi:hypothetical protein